MDKLVVNIETNSRAYQVQHLRRATVEFYGTNPIDSYEYNQILGIVTDALKGTILQRNEVIKGGHEVTRTPIGLKQRLSLKKIADSIEEDYRARKYDEQPSAEKPIRDVTIPSASFSNMPSEVYDKAQKAGLTLKVIND